MGPPKTQGTHPVLMPSAQWCPQLHATKDPILAVKKEVQQVKAVQAVHAGGHGCEVAQSGPATAPPTSDREHAWAQAHVWETMGKCSSMHVTTCGPVWGGGGHGGTQAWGAVWACNTQVCAHRAMCWHLCVSRCGHSSQSLAPTRRESTGCGGSTISFHQLKLPGPLLSLPTPAQEELHSQGFPAGTQLAQPHSALQEQGQDEHPDLRAGSALWSSPIPCVTAAEDQVNHFEWQAEGEETAATSQPRGGGSALLHHPSTA